MLPTQKLLSTNRHKRMLFRNHVSIIMAAMLAVSCSSDKYVEEQEMPQSTDPMRFGAPAIGDIVQAPTRASHPLASDFLVTATKGSGAQMVMDSYQAKYQNSGWSGTSSKWITVGDGFYKPQYEKYWDYSAFPYDFYAIAPCPVSGNAIIDGFSLSASSVKIVSPSRYQSVADGTVTPADAEGKYLLAQVRRAHPSADVTAITDVDLLTGKTISETLSPNATVKLPFHHLTSKVRFAIYTTEHVSPTLTLPITDVKITAESSSGFVTSYDSYSSSVVPGQSVLNGAYGGTQATTSVVDLLTFSGPTDGAGTVKYSDAYLEKHEWTSPTEVNAYFFECSDGIIQMPQAGVKLRVTMKIGGKEFDSYLSVDSTEEFTWEPNKLYTYYIVIRHLFSHEISFTATVSSWENIEGDISSGLEGM